MTVIIRLQFKSMPSPETLAAVIAAGVFDPAYEDSDIIDSSDLQPMSEAPATLETPYAPYAPYVPPIPEGLCGVGDALGGCVFLPNHEGKHSWQ